MNVHDTKLFWQPRCTASQVEANRVPLQLQELGPLIKVKQPQPDEEIFQLFNDTSVRKSCWPGLCQQTGCVLCWSRS